MKTGAPAAMILVGLLLLCGPACSTLETLSHGTSYLYSGTRENCRSFEPPRKDSVAPYRVLLLRPVLAVVDPSFSLAFIPRPVEMMEPFRGLRQFISVVDFPFSLALDTALVPVTIPLQLIHGDAPR
jgi:uncharacterized protein YceK